MRVSMLNLKIKLGNYYRVHDTKAWLNNCEFKHKKPAIIIKIRVNCKF